MEEHNERFSWKGVLLVVGGLLIYIWDDIFFAAPVVALAAWSSPFIAWIVGSIAFTLGSFWISLWVIKNFGEPNDRIIDFIEKSSERVHGRFGEGLTKSVGIVSFIVSSVFAGGILTTFFLAKGGYTGDLRTMSFWSCLIFGVAFSAQYSGLVAIIQTLL